MSDNTALERAEIIAALRCCESGRCAECPYRGRGIACKQRLMGEAAALLGRDAQPNAPLTCDGCQYQKREGWNYEHCIRCKRHWEDSYRRKPEGGGA